jgi:tRNA(Ile)-lysidine synthase
MSSKLLDHIVNIKLSLCEGVLLCAVSGGKDSMAMLDVLRRSGIKVACAHVNHQTRGQENENEQKLVEDYCSMYDIKCHILKLDPQFKTQSNFQAKTRTVRYDWLEELRIQNGYNKIATAHHQIDNVESLIMALMRGSGLDGLSGIAPLRSNVVRPLLIAEKSWIDQYVEDFQIPYLDDSSNFEVKYLRNKIRHSVINDLIEIDDKNIANFNLSIDRIQQSNALLKYFIEHTKDCYEKSDTGIFIDIKKLSQYPGKETFLYYLIKDYGYNSSDVTDILSSKSSPTTFLSRDYIGKLERNVFKIETKMASKKNDCLMPIEIKKEGKYRLDSDRVLHIELVSQLELYKENLSEVLGFKHPPFPILVRKRQDGDKFKPLGMKGKSQKVKDFISNNKLDLYQKDQVFLIIHKEEIAYVAPYRISDTFKIKDDTRFLLKVKIERS